MHQGKPHRTGTAAVTRSSVLTGKAPSSTTPSNERRQMPPLKNDGLVGGSGGLGFITGGAISAIGKIGATIKTAAKSGSLGKFAKQVSIFGLNRDTFKSVKTLQREIGKIDATHIKKYGDIVKYNPARKSITQNIQQAFNYPREVLKHKFPSKPVNFKGPNPAHKTGAGGNSYSTTTTGISQNAMARADMTKSLNRKPFTPAQKVEAMNLLKKL